MTIKNTIIDKVSDALSYPARRNAQKAILKADQDVKDIKLVRKTNGVDVSDKDYKDPIFKARANVNALKAQKGVLD